ncbi:MAG TPA: Rnase Y domain-containing protein, partial [Gaiellaceae bacterium]|nr:Rnase Y domain-containing protein [Gaiellaceae bacterium]
MSTRAGRRPGESIRVDNADNDILPGGFMLSAGAALIGIIVGAAAASVVLLVRSRSRVSIARDEAERLLADAEREAEATRREAQVDAREQAVALRSEIEREVQDRRVESAKIEERILQKELEVD